jgi:hypothetical protein
MRGVPGWVSSGRSFMDGCCGADLGGGSGGVAADDQRGSLPLVFALADPFVDLEPGAARIRNGERF